MEPCKNISTIARRRQHFSPTPRGNVKRRRKKKTKNSNRGNCHTDSFDGTGIEETKKLFPLQLRGKHSDIDRDSALRKDIYSDLKLLNNYNSLQHSAQNEALTQQQLPFKELQYADGLHQ